MKEQKRIYEELEMKVVCLEEEVVRTSGDFNGEIDKLSWFSAG